MYKILIIDDNAANVKQTMYLLHKNDFAIGYILEPKYAIERLLYEEFQLILLDVYMPEIDGVSLLKQIKAHEELKDIPVIMLTHDTDEDLLSKCLIAGAVDFINKPLNEKVLMARINTVIASREYIAEIKKQSEKIKKSESLITKLYSQILKDLDKARKTQYSLVSLEFPNFSSFALNSLYKPIDKVGGDFICFEHVGEDRVDCFFGDVSGHGISSAMVSCMAILAFKTAFAKKLYPKEALSFIHELLFPVVHNHFIVGAYFTYFPKKQLLQYSYAGSPLLLLRKNQIHTLEGDGTGLLMFSEVRLQEYSIQLNSGERVLLYSDGLIEVFNEKQEMYSYERFEESALKNVNHKGKVFLERILDDTLIFSNHNIKDDMAMLLLEVG
ncbi:MAG: fused response regulator/phosphatase [Spirochaetota bacterium]